MTLLAVDNVTVRYGRLTALRGISLKIAEGEVLFVTGPNGAGKSTLLNAIAGVVPPVSGTITLGDAEMAGAPPESIARRGFSLVPEGRNVFGAPDHRGESEGRRRHAGRQTKGRRRS